MVTFPKSPQVWHFRVYLNRRGQQERTWQSWNKRARRLVRKQKRVSERVSEGEWDLTLSVWSPRFSPAIRRGSGLGPDPDRSDWSGSRYTEPAGRHNKKNLKIIGMLRHHFHGFKFFHVFFNLMTLPLTIFTSKPSAHSAAMNFGLSSFYPLQNVTNNFP